MALGLYESIAARYAKLNEALSKGLLKPEISAVMSHRYAWPNKDNSTLGMANLAAAEPQFANETDHSIPFVISTQDVDRDGDIVVSMGGILGPYSQNPVVLFGHGSWQVPIGTARGPDGQLCVWMEENRVRAKVFFDTQDPDADYIYGKVKRGMLNATSISFLPRQAHQRERGKAYHDDMSPLGWVFEAWELTEFSVVAIPSNAGALRDSYDSEKSFLSPKLQKAMQPYLAQAKGCFNGYCPCPPCESRPEVKDKADPIRWNKSLSKNFEVNDEILPASTTAYDWAAKFLGCEIKNIQQSSTSVPHPRMGSFLSGLKQIMRSHQVVDTRNISGGYERGHESPPVYETIKLNSKSIDSFLIEGVQFCEEGQNGPSKHILKSVLPGSRRKFILEFSPSWNGLTLTAYSKNQHADLTKQIFDSAWEWAKANNFLKGEAFALSGDFLSRTDEGWDDVFLETKNATVLKRVTNLFNDKQLGFANRGLMFLGPPGTGKTLSGRIIRNQLKGTFIWVSSRDFHKSGSFGGISLAFEMARELAPSVIFLEDVDNWLGETTVDLLKTEMDGIARSKGVLTILTTNFPERMPEALIDRPGRFHDVLNFDLPNQKSRKEMLVKWLPGVAESFIDDAVKRTAGYSGAHVYELAQFARTLNENDGVELTKAIKDALQKIEDQKELINQIQLEGSHYKPRRGLKEMSKAMLTSGLPVKKKKACGCGGKCNTCKSLMPSGENAANNPQEEHEHEEQGAEQVHKVDPAKISECVHAKIPKLIAEGYPQDQAVAIAFHMAHENKEGDAIDGHEQVAEMYKDMGGDSGTEGGYSEGADQEQMSLKSFVKSMQKGEMMDRDEVDEKKEADNDSEDDPADVEGDKKPKEETEATDENDDPKDEETEAVESGPQFKESAVLLGHSHNHQKAYHDYLTKALPTLDHEEIAKAMTSHLPDIEGHMSDYEALINKHHKGVKMDALCKHCKSLAEGDPEREVVDNQDGSEGRDDASSTQPKRDTGGDKTGADLMREENEAVKLSPRAVEKAHATLDRIDTFLFAKTGMHV